MSCEGKPIEMQDLRTDDQKAIMKALGNYLMPNIGKTRAPYPGALNAPPDPGQLAAMDTMMGLGGRGFYNAPQMNMGPGLRVGPAAGAVSGWGAGPAQPVGGPIGGPAQPAGSHALPGVKASPGAPFSDADASYGPRVTVRKRPER